MKIIDRLRINCDLLLRTDVLVIAVTSSGIESGNKGRFLMGNFFLSTRLIPDYPDY
jgi:hypothetical protein